MEGVAHTLAQAEGISKIGRDIRNASKNMTDQEARFAVKTYYDVQHFRIENGNRIAALQREESQAPHEFLKFMYAQAQVYEQQVRSGLTAFAHNLPEWPWMEQVLGIGPIMAAGLRAHIDIYKAPVVGHVWSFAGLVPGQKWEKGQKRPWNAELKKHCWLIGKSFIKVSKRDDSRAYYGHLYRAKKLVENARNERLEFADQAEAKAKVVGRSTEAYKFYSQGKLPPAHIDARAQRYAVKMFLSHWHEVVYRLEFGVAPPAPYIIAHGGHVHHIAPPFDIPTRPEGYQYAQRPETHYKVGYIGITPGDQPVQPAQVPPELREFWMEGVGTAA